MEKNFIKQQIDIQEFPVEELKQKVFDMDDLGITVPAYKIKRFHFQGNRWYYYIRPGTKGNPPQISPFFLSNTSITSSQIPESDGLKRATDRRGGYKAMYTHMMDRSHYGSVYHICIEDLMMGVIAARMKAVQEGVQYTYVMYLDDIQNIMEQYSEQFNLSRHWVSDNLDSMIKDLSCFQQWLIDYNVRPRMVEQSLISEIHGIATTIDLLCDIDLPVWDFWGDEVYSNYGSRKHPLTGEKMKYKPGDSKWTARYLPHLSLVNVKSGKSGFHRQHEAQIHMEKMVLLENYPELEEKLHGIYNWSPSDYESNTPTYKFKEQSESREQWKVINYIQNAQIDFGDVDTKPWKTPVVSMVFGDGEPAEVIIPTVREMVEEHERGKMDHTEGQYIFTGEGQMRPTHPGHSVGEALTDLSEAINKLENS